MADKRQNPGRLGPIIPNKSRPSDTMGNVGGISMYLARGELRKNDFRLRRTLPDFSRYVVATNIPHIPSTHVKESAQLTWPARVFRFGMAQDAELDAACRPCHAVWRVLDGPQGAPARAAQALSPTLDYPISKLPGLFNSSWRLVPNHTDLLENNIHVNAGTDRIAGICDWEDTTIGPFGVSLGGLETMLGIRSMKESWIYHANQQELRALFWGAFYKAMGVVSGEQKELIGVARLVETC